MVESKTSRIHILSSLEHNTDELKVGPFLFSPAAVWSNENQILIRKEVGMLGRVKFSGIILKVLKFLV